MRALLQQLIRNRSRPQDVYDIASRMREYGEQLDMAKISEFLLRKSKARDIEPRKSSYDEFVKQQAMINYEEQIRSQATEFIPFEAAWSEVLALISRLSIPD